MINIRRLRAVAWAVLAAFLSCAAAAQAQESRLPAAVATALKEAAIPLAAVAVQVQEVGAHAPRLTVNAAQPMNPASVMKLVTTFAALDLLGPAYTWKTEARIDAPVADGVLAGDLYLKGGGDPKLTFEQFWLLLRQLRAQGIREIAGDLVLDRSLFEPPAADEAAFDDQPLRPYNVAPDALLVSFKTMRLALVPNAATKTIGLTAEPLPANLDIVNLLRLSNNGCGDWKSRLRADVTRHSDRFRLALTGSYAVSCGQKNWNLGVMPHAAYDFGVFVQLWRELGGEIRGGVRDGGAPSTARLVAAIESPSLAEIVRDINKFSNNVMARQLYLTLAAESGRRPARAADADAAIRAWLDAKGLRFPELVIENGSGLSRRERISADSLARLLQAIWKSPLMPEVIASLPLAAVDGTMKKRFNGNGASGQMHLKTGTLEDAKTVAGYVLDRRGHRQAVVFLINHANAQAGQAAQDALLQWVYEGGTP
ncbi:MAG: D-alanyl-D-alanine carboxypeptidase/D-alanyl-D-alanine-endopeptidase [Rhodocyclales bacterium]|nr:D-alanyl-D-alanine carboxypeptidase/D-alanyl-D-alanine-endopeptidase [Rhodocyclales bacterium]